MSDPLEIGPDDGRRQLWLFALHVKGDDIDHWEPPRVTAPRPWPLEDALGVGKLDPTQVQVFEAADLGRGGLRKFLVEAVGMDAGEVEADARAIDGLHTTAVLVFDKAVTARPARFDPQLPLRFIGHYRAPVSLSPAAPMPDLSAAHGNLAGSGETGPAPRFGRAAGLVTGLFALIILAVLIWSLA